MAPERLPGNVPCHRQESSLLRTVVWMRCVLQAILVASGERLCVAERRSYKRTHTSGWLPLAIGATESTARSCGEGGSGPILRGLAHQLEDSCALLRLDGLYGTGAVLLISSELIFCMAEICYTKCRHFSLCSQEREGTSRCSSTKGSQRGFSYICTLGKVQKSVKECDKW
jgi:hypothetical protein